MGAWRNCSGGLQTATFRNGAVYVAITLLISQEKDTYFPGAGTIKEVRGGSRDNPPLHTQLGFTPVYDRQHLTATFRNVKNPNKSHLGWKKAGPQEETTGVP
ncbi:hypothetical protein Bbelb_098400 [Branchiostoma belcheri]|nr:hypothetical protein Bbelb_098400 [Branchiostoma belcheri]